MSAAIVRQCLLVSLVPVMRGAWMAHVDGPWSHIVQPSPLSTATNGPSLCPGIPAYFS